MVLSSPRDLLASFPGWTTEFELIFRQERSRTAGGKTIVKDFGRPLWRAAYETTALSPNMLDRWRAILDSVDGGSLPFLGYSLSRVYPIAYPNASWPGVFTGSAQVGSVGANNKSLTLKGLPAGFKVSIGDMVQVGVDKLYRVMEDTVAGSGGQTGLFEVRPHLFPGTAEGFAAVLVKPATPMKIVPDSIKSAASIATGRGTISFQAMEA
jgi:hypothetical protein